MGLPSKVCCEPDVGIGGTELKGKSRVFQPRRQKGLEGRGGLGLGSRAFWIRPPMTNDENDSPTAALPDRLSTNPASPFHNPELLERGVGIKFNGVDRTNVEEYCVSEGW